MSRIPALVILLAGLAYGQSQPERFWLAGRYDGNRVIVYFDAVKFNRTVPADAHKIVQPVVNGFYDPVELPASYIAQFLKKPGAESFALGDQYDLLTGEGTVVTITLTTLVGTEADEETGNDSYIGALAAVKDRDVLFLHTDYYAVRRHRPETGRPAIANKPSDWAHIVDEPLRFSVQSRIAALLTQRMKVLAPPEEWAHFQNVSPRFSVQSFYLADGALRYYAMLDWGSHVTVDSEDIDDMLCGWLAPTAVPRILAVETHLLPNLRNVVELGAGRTGLIVDWHFGDSGGLQLVEYRDGMNLKQMPHLNEISAGE